MGMFDYVNFTVPCSRCGAEIVGFQSKDGPCELEHIDPWKLDHFYSSCSACGLYIEYNRRTPVRFDWLLDYDILGVPK